MFYKMCKYRTVFITTVRFSNTKDHDNKHVQWLFFHIYCVSLLIFFKFINCI